MADYPNTTGLEYSFTSGTLKVDGRTYFVSSVSYGDGLEPGMIDINGRVPGGWTAGKWSGDDATVEMPKSQARTLINDLGDGYGTRNVQVIWTWAEDGMPTHTDELPTCRISKVADAPGGAPEASKVTLTLKLLEPIIRDGKRIVKRPSAAI